MGSPAVTTPQDDYQIEPPAQQGASASSDDYAIEIPHDSQQQGPVNPYANPPSWRDELTQTHPLDTKQTGNKVVDYGINAAANFGAGLLTPFLHPLKTAESMGQTVVASGMAPGGMYPTTAPTGNPQIDHSNEQAQRDAQEQVRQQALWMKAHPGEAIPAALGGVGAGALTGEALGAFGGGAVAPEAAAVEGEGAAAVPKPTVLPREVGPPPPARTATTEVPETAGQFEPHPSAALPVRPTPAQLQANPDALYMLGKRALELDTPPEIVVQRLGMTPQEVDAFNARWTSAGEPGAPAVATAANRGGALNVRPGSEPFPMGSAENALYKYFVEGIEKGEHPTVVGEDLGLSPQQIEEYWNRYHGIEPDPGPNSGDYGGGSAGINSNPGEPMRPGPEWQTSPQGGGTAVMEGEEAPPELPEIQKPTPQSSGGATGAQKPPAIAVSGSTGPAPIPPDPLQTAVKYVQGVLGGAAPAAVAAALNMTLRQQERVHVAAFFTPNTIGSLLKTSAPSQASPVPVQRQPQDAAGIQQQAQQQTVAEAAASAQTINAKAADIAQGIPPPKPPSLPLPQGMDEGLLSQNTVDLAGSNIMRLPLPKRTPAILETVGNVAKWMLDSKTVIAPDGKVVNVDSPKTAQSEAVKIINAEIDRQNELIHAKAKAQQDATKERQENAQQAQEERDEAITPTETPKKSTGSSQPVEIPDTPAVQKARAALAAAPDDSTEEQRDALIRRTATVTKPVRDALVKEDTQRRANRQEDHAQAGMMGEDIPSGQSREELQRWADAVKDGKHPFVHVPANVAFKPAGVEDLTRTPVKGAGPFSGTYYHPKEIDAAEIRKAARDKKDPQGALDALVAKFKGEKPAELKAEDVEQQNPQKEGGRGETPEQPEAVKTSAAPGSEGIKRGEVGMMLATGEVVLTATGRKTTPFPKIDTESDRKTGNTIKRVDQWLMENAIAEAKARGDEFNLRQFEANKAKPSQGDKDSAEYYLFDKDFIQPTHKPLLKPAKIETPLDKFEGEGKSPYEITQKEWTELQRAHRRAIGQDETSGTKAAPYSDYEEYHRDSVKTAIKYGLDVPEAVLADYPDLKPVKLPSEVATGLAAIVEEQAADDPTATLDSVLRDKDTGHFVAQALVNDGIITNSADDVNPATALLTTSARAKVGDALLAELLPQEVIEQTPDFLKQKLLGSMGSIQAILSAPDNWNLQNQITFAVERYNQIFRGMDTQDQGPVVEAILKKLDEPIDKMRQAFSQFAVAALNHDPSDKPFLDFNLAFGAELTSEQFTQGMKPAQFLGTPSGTPSPKEGVNAGFEGQNGTKTPEIDEQRNSHQKPLAKGDKVTYRTNKGKERTGEVAFTDGRIVRIKDGGSEVTKKVEEVRALEGPAETGVRGIVLPVGAAAPKERWQMTLAEAKKAGWFDGHPMLWTAAVVGALKDGKPVPFDVMTDFERYTGSEIDTKYFDEAAKREGRTHEWDPTATPGPAAKETLVDALYRVIVNGQDPRNYTELEGIIFLLDGARPNQLRMKQAQEAYEAAQNRIASGLVNSPGWEGRAVFDALVRRYEKQPNLSIRTSTSIQNQAYSTPLPLAFVADRFAGIDGKRGGTVYEPTAGNGNLLIAANPGSTQANELDPARAQTLKDEGFAVTQNDATVWQPATRFDAVVANPPFGPLAGPVKVDGYSVVKLDHLIIAKALGVMKDDGKACVILAAGDREKPGEITNQVRPFFNWLYAHYNVVSDFELDGDLYSRQGASFPVRVIAIDGRVHSAKVSPMADAIQRLTTWEDVYGKAAEYLGPNLEGKRQANDVAGGPVRTESADQGAVSGTAAGPNRPTDSREPGASPAGDGGGGNVIRSGLGPVSHTGGVPVITVGSTSATTRPDGDVARSDRLAEGQPAPRTVRRESSKPDGHPADALTESIVDESNQFQVSFRPLSEKRDVGIMAPKALVDPMLRAMAVIRDEVGDLDQFVADQLGYVDVPTMHEVFMGIQVDAIAAAIYQMQRGKAVIVADQTGVGKGRVAAAMLRWSDLHNYLPVFVTEKANLFSDMYRDLQNIGSGQTITPLLFNADASITDPRTGAKVFQNPGAMRPVLDRIRETGELPKGRNAVFLTYSQINKEDNRQQLTIQRIAQNAIFVLDESHNAGGDSNTGNFLSELLAGSKGVVFLSATWAKRPDNLPLYAGKTDISIAIPDRARVADAITAGGAPLQAVLTSLLADTGQFIRRERSFDGIEFKPFTDEKGKAKAEQISDQVTEILRAILKADKMYHEIDFKRILAAAVRAGKSADTKGLVVSHFEFSSTVHNLVRQLLLALKAEVSVAQIVASIERGERPIYALENTAGSFLEEYIDGNNLTEGSPLRGLDFSRVTDRTLMRTRYYNEKSVQGGPARRIEVPLNDLSPAVREAYDYAQSLIDALKVDLPVSPIDYIRNGVEKAGYKVAEITGREWAIDYSGDVAKLTKVPAIERNDRVNTQMQFNNGITDALIINRAAAAGISLHASLDFRDVRPRHMIVGQPAADVNVVVQMLGRINRTGQVVLPLYTMLASAVPAEQRPQMNLAKKMKSLNANVSSNTRAATSVQAVDLMNKYGDHIVAGYLIDNPEMAKLLGLSADTNKEGEASGNEGLATKATGHSALLPVSQQQEFMDSITQAYTNYIDFLDETGQNDLEPRTYDYAARELHTERMYQGTDETSPFGQDATYGEYSIKRQGKPFTPEEVMEKIADALGPEAMKLPAYQRDTLAARDIANHFEELYKPYYAGLTAASSLERAQQIRTRGRQLLNDYRVGTGLRIEISGEFYNGVVTNIEGAKKPSGNPYAPSSLQFTIAVNGGLRQTKVPGSQMDALVTSNLGRNADIRQLFKDYGTDRQKVKIITGNLLGAFGELKTGSKGRIISFTMDDGTSKLGIQMPAKFDIKTDVSGTYAMRTPEGALAFLKLGDMYLQSSGSEIGIWGPSHRNPEWEIRTKVSKAASGKFFLDPKLLETVQGENFASINGLMRATVKSGRELDALKFIMGKIALYAGTSHIDQARTIDEKAKAELDKPKPPRLAKPISAASSGPALTEMERRVLEKIKSQWTSGENLLYDFGESDSEFREMNNAVAALVRQGLLERRDESGSLGPDFRRTPEGTQALKNKPSSGSVTMSFLGSGALDPYVTRVLQPVVDYAKKAVVSTWKEATAAIRKTGRTGKQIGREVAAALAPEMLADTDALDIMGKALGEPALRLFEAGQFLHSVDQMFNKMSEDERIDFVDRWQTGKEQPTQDLQQAQEFMQEVLSQQRMREKVAINLGRKKADQKELSDKSNYFPNRYKVAPGGEKTLTEDQQIARLGQVSRRPFEGSKAFMKQQRYTLKQAVEDGAVPLGNPVEMLLRRLQEGAKFVAARYAWYNFKDQGLATFLKNGKKLPADYAYVDDKSANVWRVVESIEGDIIPLKTGRWIIQKDAARLLNNYLSVDHIASSDTLTTLVKIKNFSTEMKLAISAFHWAYITVENLASGLNTGMEKVVNQGIRALDPTKVSAGLADIAKSMVAPYTAIKRGGQIIQYARTPDEFLESPEGKKFAERYPDFPHLMELLFAGGLRWNIAKQFRESFGDHCLDAWKDGEIGKGIGKFLPWLSHGLMSPLFDHYIPRSKWAFAIELLSTKLAQYSYAIAMGEKTEEEIAREVAATTDNRFGELNWDSLYLNNDLKGAMQFFFRSATWAIGSWRGAYQAVKEQASSKMFDDKMFQHFDEQAKKGDWISQARRATSRLPQLGVNAGWILSMALLTSTLGSVTEKLATGKFPWDWAHEDSKTNGFSVEANAALEAMHPRTGAVDEHGEPVRVSWPTGLKDYEHGFESPAKYAKGKVSDVAINAWGSMAENRDAFGNYVYNPNDPLYREMWQGFKYNAVGDLTPMSADNWMRPYGPQDTASKLERFTGMIGGAPKALDRSHALTEALERRAVANPHAPMTPEQQAEREFAKDHPTLRSIRQAAREKNLTYLDRVFKELNYTDAKAVYDDPKTSPAERAELKPFLDRKRIDSIRNGRRK